MDGRVIGVINRRVLLAADVMVRLFVAVASDGGRYQCRRFHQHYGSGAADGDRRRRDDRRSVLDDGIASSAGLEHVT